MEDAVYIVYLDRKEVIYDGRTTLSSDLKRRAFELARWDAAKEGTDLDHCHEYSVDLVGDTVIVMFSTNKPVSVSQPSPTLVHVSVWDQL